MEKYLRIFLENDHAVVELQLIGYVQKCFHVVGVVHQDMHAAILVDSSQFEDGL